MMVQNIEIGAENLSVDYVPEREKTPLTEARFRDLVVNVYCTDPSPTSRDFDLLSAHLAQRAREKNNRPASGPCMYSF
jgi:hypothetical protein